MGSADPWKKWKNGRNIKKLKHDKEQFSERGEVIRVIMFMLYF